MSYLVHGDSVGLKAVLTRDLKVFRKTKSKVVSICGGFVKLLTASPTEDPQSSLVRACFFSAVTASLDRLGRDQAGEVERRIVDVLTREPPPICLFQGLYTPERIALAWQSTPDLLKTMVFMPFALHTELNNLQESGDREQEGKLALFTLACFANELAHWLFVNTHGYSNLAFPMATPLMNSGASISTTHTRTSISSSSSSVAFVKSENRDDVGNIAVVALFGADFELLTYTIGEREVIKRRVPSRRTPALSPPTIYALTGDSPAILDASGFPTTSIPSLPPWKADDMQASMYRIVSVLTPSSSGEFHGTCYVTVRSAAPSIDGH